MGTQSRARRVTELRCRHQDELLRGPPPCGLGGCCSVLLSCVSRSSALDLSSFLIGDFWTKFSQGASLVTRSPCCFVSLVGALWRRQPARWGGASRATPPSGRAHTASLFPSSLPALLLQVTRAAQRICNLLVLVIWTLRYFITEFLISDSRKENILEFNVSYIYVNLCLHLYSYLLFHVYPGYKYPFKSILVLTSNFSLSDECTVMLVCINPMDKHRAFVNYAFTVIIIA